MAPTRAAVLVEGQTEESFVEQVLRPLLWDADVDLQPIVVETSRTPAGRKRSGGGGSWTLYRRDLARLLGSRFAAVTTMIDFYAYPRDAPGWDCPRPHRPRECVLAREEAMALDIDDRRFLPYLALHEFETLVIASASLGGPVCGDDGVGELLRRHADEVGGDVELLNDTKQGAPSSRVVSSWPAYDKVLDGVAAVGERNMDDVLALCPHAADWVDRMRDLG